MGYTIYRDKFMSGWGHAPRGSYVVVQDGAPQAAGFPWPREEFKTAGQVQHLRQIRKALLSRGRHVEVWHLVGGKMHKWTLASGEGRGSGRPCGSFFNMPE